jgi:hypothetical protein
MFLIRTRVGPSSIHGNGVFAMEAATVGQTIWRYDPVYDPAFSQAQFDAAPPATQAFLEMYAYRAIDLAGAWVLSGDHARFLNHSDRPNTTEVPFESRAAAPIAAGDEITCDYGAFCAGWSATELGPSVKASPPAPHRDLYTRIGRGVQGVGVIAIRDIPSGTVLFVGDEGATVRVPVAEVEAIEDAAVRQMYFDFCPEKDGAFVAPANFNQLTIGWHVNHSDVPNVAVADGLRFVTKRLIYAGEELTTDYATYSQSARRFIPTWGGTAEKA